MKLLRTILVLCMFSLFSLGCAPTLTGLRAATNRVSETFAATEPALEKQRRRQGETCFLDYPPGDIKVRTCLDGVDARWHPVEMAVDAVFAAIVAAQGTMGTAEAAALIGRSPSVIQVAAVVARAVDAALRLDAAVQALHHTPPRTP